ncbi:MAG: alpha-2-macroglobulin family protein [Anaerolineae bacterium]|nr:alpha-2-macroglobulin family protein [Anaerolineae bacterium]
MAKRMITWIGRHRVFVLVAGVLLAVGALAGVVALLSRGDATGGAGGVTIPALADAGSTGGGLVAVSAASPGREAGQGGAEVLPIRLSEGSAEVQEPTPVPVASGESLTEDEIEGILARLPALAAGAEDQVDFRLPAQSLPPPRTGETVDEPFPPPPAVVTPEAVEAGPLEVLRYAPEGEIPLAPFVNVTFNQPMVPLATLDALADEDVPVQLEPALDGTWKWLGTRTLSFEYDSAAIDRLPMATEYVVMVPAGTRSATGGTLAEAVRWTFRTPPASMIASYPSGESQPLEPLFLVAFDQRVTPGAVLETIQVTADGQEVAVRLADAEAVSADKAAKRIAEDAGEGRWLAFVAREPLPADAAIQVTVGPGTPSAEGPLVSEEAQSYDFRTYAPLRIVDHGCWWRNECPPLTPFSIEFNNPLDVDAYEESMIRIEPALPGATVDVARHTITIRGSTAGRTTYRVTVSGSIQDTFGQTLGEDARLTFEVGPAEPALYGPDEGLVTLDPALQKPVLQIYAVNHDRLRVRAYQVQPADWPGFKGYLQAYYRENSPAEPPGRRVMDEVVATKAAADTLTEVNLDLGPALEGGLGQLIVVVEPEKRPRPEDRYRNVVHAWVQSTQIGLDALADHSEMVVWTTALADGAPLQGVTIETYGGAGSASKEVAATGEDGTARFDLPDQRTDLLVARRGADLAILPRHSHPWSDDGWQARPVRDELRWYVFDDRAMYRPGEEVHVKGWLRRVGGRQDGDVGLAGDVLQGVDYQFVDPQGNELLSGQAPVNALGGFDLAFTVPENTNLGYAYLQFRATGSLGGLDGLDYGHGVQVQEFRRPEFEVVARNETGGPYFAGGQATVAVEASYYAGGPLPNAEVTWRVSTSPSSYAPPNWPEFIFGRWRPWWFAYEPMDYRGGYPPYPSRETTVETLSGMTDASGSHYLRLDFEQPDEPQPHSVLAEATVMDVNRQAWAGTTSLLVHPAELYVGLRSERTFVQRGDPLKIDLIVVDLDGVPEPDRPIHVRAARLEWRTMRGAWRQEAVDVQECTVGSTEEPVSCTFETAVGGEYQITATVSDAFGRENESQLTRWVSGGQRPPSRKVEQETVTLIPDRESYQPGDVAEILVQAPFSPAEGLLTVSRSGFLYTEQFRIDEGTATLRVPIEEEHIPNLEVQVDVVGAAPRGDDEQAAGMPLRPAYASGQLRLSVPPLKRTLSLAATPREKELEPGGETTIDVVLADAGGQPVAGAELAVVVVDEAVLALSNYQLADPLEVFYQARAAWVESRYGRASIVLASPQALEVGDGQEVGETVAVEEEAARELMSTAAPVPAAAPPMEGYDQAQEAEPIHLRTDFNALATFAPEVRTDAGGQAQVTVALPDNLTRYRVMVVAVAGGNEFGSAEANLVARLPLMVRPSAPRFLNFGDQFELPVVLQNQTDEPLTVDVALRASNLVLTGDAGRRLTVPARDRVEVRFPATTETAGTARFQVAAVSGAFADAATVELPVYTPATTEAFATYGVVDEGAVAQPVAAIGDGVYTQFGGLEISTSSTALQALTDAVLYLVSYRFECTEQLASRILAVAALRDVLEAFSAGGLPSPAEMEAAVERDIAALQAVQNDDGGFPYWSRGRESIPFNSIHVAHALQRAEEMDFLVPPEMRARLLDYLRDIEGHYPAWYDKDTRQTLSAYALYVRDLMGDGDAARARQLLADAGLESLSLEAVAWLWQVLADDPGSAGDVEAIQRHLANRAVETAGAANFTTAYSDQAYLLLRSDRRTDAIVLEAMIANDPRSDLIPKVVNGLLAHRTAGRWNNTQENVFVLLALDRYFKTFEAQTPDFVARLWLGDTYVGEHAYQGRTTERHETAIPMAYLADSDGGGTTRDLILGKEGPGRLYYRLGLRYAPTDLALEPLDMGFVVQRSYEGVDDPEDVTRGEDGTWTIKAGARVRVRLSMVAGNRRYHVALVDPLPAGLEIVNPSLAVSGSVPQDPNAAGYRYGWWWWGPWYEHQNMRDERAEAFAPLLWEGVYDYSYVARATTPGTFVVPPARAEEMYSPEVFGRSASDRVTVE